MWDQFIETRIAEAPTAQGAYRLYKDTRVIYVGMAAGGATLRSELNRHARGHFGALSQAATHFDYRVADDAQEAYRVYLDLYLSSGLWPAESRQRTARRRAA